MYLSTAYAHLSTCIGLTSLLFLFLSQFDMSSNNNFYRSLTNITGCLANNHNSVTNIKGSTFEALPQSGSGLFSSSCWLECIMVLPQWLKVLVKTLFYLFLLAFFCQFYFIGQMSDFFQKKDNNRRQKGKSQSSWATNIYNLLGPSFQSFKILRLQFEFSPWNLLVWFSQWNLGSTIWQS